MAAGRALACNLRMALMRRMSVEERGLMPSVAYFSVVSSWESRRDKCFIMFAQQAVYVVECMYITAC